MRPRWATRFATGSGCRRSCSSVLRRSESGHPSLTEERTMSRPIQRIAPSLALLVAFVGGLFLTLSAGAAAQEKFKYSFQNPAEISSVYKETHNIDVADMPGHVMRVSSLQTVYP